MGTGTHNYPKADDLSSRLLRPDPWYSLKGQVQANGLRKPASLRGRHRECRASLSSAEARHLIDQPEVSGVEAVAQMTGSRQYKVVINSSIIDKPARDSGVKQTTDWTKEEFSEAGFIKEIQKGHAFSAHFRSNYRKAANFLCSDFVAADVNGAFSVEEARKQPFIQSQASFIYTTPSRSEARHQFRIVLLLEKTITNASDWADCHYGLAHKLGSDRSIKDGGRLFYGNRRTQISRIGRRLAAAETDGLITVDSV